MKISLGSKKKAIVILVLFVFFVFLFIFFYNNLSKKEELGFDYCERNRLGDEVIIECYMFLENFEINGRKEACLSAIIPETDISERNFSYCIKADSVNWDNPYNDYSRSIPVILRFHTRQNEDFLLSGLLGSSEIYRLDIEVMDNDLAYKIANEYNSQISNEEDKITYITPQLVEVMERGYLVTSRPYGTMLGLEEDLFDVISIGNVKIKDYRIRNEEIIFQMVLNIEGKELNKEIRTTSFAFTVDNKLSILDYKSDISKYISFDGNYEIDLLIKGYEKFDSLSLEVAGEYLTGSSNLEGEIKGIYIKL